MYMILFKNNWRIDSKYPWKSDCKSQSIIKRTKEQVLALLWESERSNGQTAEPGDSGWSPHSQMSGQMCFGINDAFERVPNRIISQSVVVPQLLSKLSMKYRFEIFLSPKSTVCPPVAELAPRIFGQFFFRQTIWAELEWFLAASSTATVQVNTEKVKTYILLLIFCSWKSL